jgi:hypothetical protein
MSNKSTPATIAKSSSTRSRVTNGSDLFAGDVDHRTAYARRAKDLMALHVSDAGGDNYISEATRSIIRRAVTLTIEIERLESAWAGQGGCSDVSQLDLHQRASGNLRRLLEAIGLERKQRDVTPDLSDYLAGAGR